MALKLTEADFADTSLGVRATVTQDAQVFSLLFDHLGVASESNDTDATPQVLRAEGTVRCQGRGWVTVHARGAAQVAGSHGYAQVMGWANGRRFRLAADSADEPMAASVTARVGSDGELRLSLLLLAQRDLSEANSAAACWVDSLDIEVVQKKARSRGQA